METIQIWEIEGLGERTIDKHFITPQGNEILSWSNCVEGRLYYNPDTKLIQSLESFYDFCEDEDEDYVMSDTDIYNLIDDGINSYLEMKG